MALTQTSCVTIHSQGAIGIVLLQHADANLNKTADLYTFKSFFVSHVQYADAGRCVTSAPCCTDKRHLSGTLLNRAKQYLELSHRVELQLSREVAPVGGHLGVDAGQPELPDLPLRPLKQLASLAGC